MVPLACKSSSNLHIVWLILKRDYTLGDWNGEQFVCGVSEQAFISELHSSVQSSSADSSFP